MSEAARAQEVLKRLVNTTADESGTWLELRLADGAAEDGDEPIVREEVSPEFGNFFCGEIVKFFREVTGQKLLSSIHRAGDDAQFVWRKCEVAPADFIGNRGAERCIQGLLRQSIRLIGKQKRQSG